MLEKGTKVFGHWSVETKIGSGAFGTVYKLRREEFGSEFFSALKVISIPPENVDSSVLQSEGMSKKEISTYYSDIAMSLMEEIKLLEELKGNSNIVSYEDHIVEASEDGMAYTIMIRMELLVPFKNKIIEETMDNQEICKLGIDICNALELCEKKKIIHRDIKPDNIFISNTGTYKLGDFGVARTMEKTVAAMSQKGTYSYMAPEVFSGKEYNQNVDLYSLGILLYQLFNKNRTPFLPEAPLPIKFSNREEAQKKRMSGEILPEIKDLPDAWNCFLLKACHPEPEKRFQSAVEMKTVLEKMLSGDVDFVCSFEEKEMEESKESKESVSEKNSGELSEMFIDSVSLLYETVKAKKTKNSGGRNKKEKEYLEWLMCETTSPKYTMFFFFITIFNSLFVFSFFESREWYYYPLCIPAILICSILLIVKLINFLSTIIGKKGFLKRIPLYIITSFCNLSAISILSIFDFGYEFYYFIIGIVLLVIPFLISLAYKPDRKIIFFINRFAYYIGLFLYACFSCGVVRFYIYLDDAMLGAFLCLSLVLSVVYPIIINKFSQKNELTKKGN